MSDEQIAQLDWCRFDNGFPEDKPGLRFHVMPLLGEPWTVEPEGRDWERTARTLMLMPGLLYAFAWEGQASAV